MRHGDIDATLVIMSLFSGVVVNAEMRLRKNVEPKVYGRLRAKDIAGIVIIILASLRRAWLSHNLTHFSISAVK